MASQQRETSFLRSALGGFLAAGSATVVFHPIDTIKVVLQRGNGPTTTAYTASSRDSCAASPSPAQPHGTRQPGTMPRFSSTLRELGARGLWRGVVPAGVSMSAACAVRMGAYEMFKLVLLPSNGESEVDDHSARAFGEQASAPLRAVFSPTALVALSSASAVVVSALVRAPLDMVKTQLQAGSTTSLTAAMHHAWAHGGISGFYRGAGLALMRDVPFFTINLVLYEQLRLAVRSGLAARSLDNVGEVFTSRSVPRGMLEELPELSTAEAMVTGALAQGVAGWVTNPVDVLKTRVQASPTRIAVGTAFQNVLRDGGLRGLMRGALMRTIWIAPQGMIYYPVYEWVQQLR